MTSDKDDTTRAAPHMAPYKYLFYGTQHHCKEQSANHLSQRPSMEFGSIKTNID